MTSVEYVGHATALVELDGARVLTDPLLRQRVAHLRRVAPVDPEPLRGVDAVLLSHGHYDHLDLPSLRALGRGVRLVCPAGLGTLLRRRGFTRVEEVRAGDEVRMDGVRVHATPAEHEGGRPPFARAQAVGFVLEGSASVYFAGDTDLFDGMESLAPGLDLALVPVWGWGPTLGPGHLDPERAAEAVRRLRPRAAIPIHWGTYLPLHVGLAGPPGFLREPADAFARALARVAPEVEARVLAPGERTEVSP